MILGVGAEFTVEVDATGSVAVDCVVEAAVGLVISTGGLVGILFMDELQPSRRKASPSVMKMRIMLCSSAVIYRCHYRAKKTGFQERQEFGGGGRDRVIWDEFFTRFLSALHSQFTIERYIVYRIKTGTGLYWDFIYSISLTGKSQLHANKARWEHVIQWK